jgi:hypothetical protein
MRRHNRCSSHALDKPCEINSTGSGCVGEIRITREWHLFSNSDGNLALTRLREKLSLRADDKIHLFGAVTAAAVAERNLSFTLAKYLGVLLNFKQLGQSFAKVATEKWAGRRVTPSARRRLRLGVSVSDAGADAICRRVRVSLSIKRRD